MITHAETMPLLLGHAPGFAEPWRRHRAWWGGDEAGLCNDLSAFAEYLEGRILGDGDDLPLLFSLVERLIAEGEPDVADAAATCLLENLLNRTPSVLDPTRYIPLLGAQSRVYARAWDEFTGVRTAGLWAQDAEASATDAA